MSATPALPSVTLAARSAPAKTTLLEMLCEAMKGKYDLVAITNDI